MVQVQCESSPIILHSSWADRTLNESDTLAIVRDADGWEAFSSCPSIMVVGSWADGESFAFLKNAVSFCLEEWNKPLLFSYHSQKMKWKDAVIRLVLKKRLTSRSRSFQIFPLYLLIFNEVFFKITNLYIVLHVVYCRNAFKHQVWYFCAPFDQS